MSTSGGAVVEGSEQPVVGVAGVDAVRDGGPGRALTSYLEGLQQDGMGDMGG